MRKISTVLGIAGIAAFVSTASKGLGRTYDFLCSATAGYITGQKAVINDGRYPDTF